MLDRGPEKSEAQGFGAVWARWRETGKIATVVWPTIAMIAFIAIWELICQLEIVNPIIVPAASDVADALIDLFQQGYFWENTWVTVKETLIGFFIGVGGAWVLGTLIGIFRIFRLAFYPLVIDAARKCDERSLLRGRVCHRLPPRVSAAKHRATDTYSLALCSRFSRDRASYGRT